MEWNKEVLLAQQGNKDSFVRLIKSIETSLYRTAKSFLKNDMDCADSIQETIIKAYNSLRFLKEPKSFKSWILKILTNECLKVLNFRKKNVPWEDFSLLTSVNSTSDNSIMEKSELRMAIESLEEYLQVIVNLYYFEDLTIKEIAHILNIPEGTVKSRLSRVRTKLSKLLNYHEGSD